MADSMITWLRIVVCCAVFATALPLSVTATDARIIHVDAAARTPGNGTAATPFQSVESALAAAPPPGAVIQLAAGFYGDFVLRQAQNLTISGRDGAQPAVFSSVIIEDSAGISLKAVTVDWSSRTGPATEGKSPAGSGVAVRIDRSRDILVEGLTVRSAEDGTGWTAEEWLANAANGISATGQNLTIRNNRLFFVRHGVALYGANGVVEGNTVAHFSGDGLRAIGDFNLVQDNFVHSCYRVDANHDDGFQSWSLGPDGRAGTGVSKGTILRRNRIFSYLEPGHPLQCRLQGIGMFDGIYEDWVIENNLVVVDHWHGITVMGAQGVIIRNNTVFDPEENRVGPAGVRILPHKDGRLPQRSAVSNNLLPGKARQWPKGFPASGQGVDYSGNMFYGNPRNVFRDPGNLDFRPHAKSYANDYAKGAVPPDDLLGSPRPWGKRGDVGAFEYRGE